LPLSLKRKRHHHDRRLHRGYQNYHHRHHHYHHRFRELKTDAETKKKNVKKKVKEQPQNSSSVGAWGEDIWTKTEINRL